MRKLALLGLLLCCGMLWNAGCDKAGPKDTKPAPTPQHTPESTPPAKDEAPATDAPPAEDAPPPAMEGPGGNEK